MRGLRRKKVVRLLIGGKRRSTLVMSDKGDINSLLEEEKAPLSPLVEEPSTSATDPHVEALDLPPAPSLIPPPMDLIVVTTSLYKGLEDTRYPVALDTCHAAATHQVPLWMIDASLSTDVPPNLEEAGRMDGQDYVRVLPQSVTGKKGAALREGIQLALAAVQERHPDSWQECILAFQEPEKVDMVRRWKDLVAWMKEKDIDIAVPSRSQHTFAASYPIEQYHAERFANLYLNSLGAVAGLPTLDWTMGPIAFKAKWATEWLSYKGELWDAQMIPMIRAHRNHQAVVASYQTDFVLPESLQRQEEGSPVWSEKRLLQLNHLFQKVGNELKVSRIEV